MSIRRLDDAIQAGREMSDNEEEEEKELEWHLEVGHGCQVLDERDGVYSLRYSPDGRMLAVAYGDGTVEVMSALTGQVDREVRRHRYGMIVVVTCLRWHPRLAHVVCAANTQGKVQSCSILDGACDDMVKEDENEIFGMDFSSNGDCFATGGKDLDIRIYDTELNKMVKQYSGYSYSAADQQQVGHAQKIFSVKFHPESPNLFITGGWDNHIKIWDVRSKDGVVSAIGGPHICGDSLDIKGDKILTGSWIASDALQLWDLSSGSLIQTLPFTESRGGQAGQFIYSAAFCAGSADLVVAGGSGTCSMQAVNTTKAEVVGELNLGRSVQAVTTVGAPVGGHHLVAVGGMASKMWLASLTEK